MMIELLLSQVKMEFKEYLEKLKEISNITFEEIQELGEEFKKKYNRYVCYDNYSIEAKCDLEGVILPLIERDYNIRGIDDALIMWEPKGKCQSSEVYKMGLSIDQQKELIKNIFEERRKRDFIVKAGDRRQGNKRDMMRSDFMINAQQIIWQ